MSLKKRGNKLQCIYILVSTLLLFWEAWKRISLLFNNSSSSKRIYSNHSRNSSSYVLESGIFSKNVIHDTTKATCSVDKVKLHYSNFLLSLSNCLHKSTMLLRQNSEICSNLGMWKSYLNEIITKITIWCNVLSRFQTSKQQEYSTAQKYHFFIHE